MEFLESDLFPDLAFSFQISSTRAIGNEFY